jgi:hypothetical protein
MRDDAAPDNAAPDNAGRADALRDDGLRERLADWVRPVASAPIPDIRALRRRARRRGIRRAATATTIAVVLAAVVTTVAVAGVTGGVAVGVAGKGRPAAGRPAASRSAAPGIVTRGAWQPAGPLPAADAAPATQPYIVLLPAGDGTATVRNVFTFHTVATIAPLPGQFMVGIAAAGDDRTFVIQAEVGGTRQQIHGKKVGPPISSSTIAFDELRLDADYRPLSLVKLFTVPANDVDSTFAISQDASMLAYSTGNGFETVSLATGARRSWPGVDGGGASIGTMAWAGDQHLVFEWTSNSASGQPAAAGTRLLDVAAGGNMLQASRLIVPFGQHCSSRAGWCDPPAITADGSKLLMTKDITTGGDTTGSVQEVSVRTGQVLAVVAPPVTQLTPGPNCLALWSDPSADQMILSCAAHSERYDHGHISPIVTRQPMNGTDFGTFAW